MRSPLLFTAIAIAAIHVSTTYADILIDDVMTREDQKKTGVANLSLKQKIALEAWINDHFILKDQPKHNAEIARSLSININNGEKLLLSDNSLWEIDPKDRSVASVWITPFPVNILPSGDKDYPSLIVNINSGATVKARQIPNQQLDTPPPAQQPETPFVIEPQQPAAAPQAPQQNPPVIVPQAPQTPATNPTK